MAVRPDARQRRAAAKTTLGCATYWFIGRNMSDEADGKIAGHHGGSERVLPCFSIIPRGAIEQRGQCGPSAQCGTTGLVMQAWL
jgi:hypothetical protein